MNAADFNKKTKELIAIAEKHEWQMVSTDASTGRVTFRDRLSIYRIDVYTTKMTVSFLPIGDKPIYLKRQDMQMIENIMNKPYLIES